MRHIKSIIALTALLLTSTYAWADKEFTYIYQLDGAASTKDAAGTVVPSFSGTTATLTVTPKEGNYFETDGISVSKTISGQYAQGRQLAPSLSEPVALTVSGTPSITGETKFTFTVDDEKYDYEVTVNFKTRTSISGATITASGAEFTYTGSEIKPSVTKVVLSSGTELASTNYSVTYENNINVPATANDPQPTIIVTGSGIYTGTATKTFTINKADPVLTFSSATASITFGNESAFTKPTLTTTPEGLTVTYESKSTDKATVNATTGDITPVAAGENIEIKANFAGNDNYNSTSASYMLTIVKGTATVSTAPTAKTLTYTGAAQTLVNAGVATNGEMQYKIGTDGTYSTDIPTGTEAKDYTVYYKAATTNANQFSDSGEASITVTIGKKTIANVTIENIASQTYTGSAIEPTVTVKDGETTLVLNTDYTVSYSNNINAATASATNAPTVTITGKGNYDSNTTATKTFTISKATMVVSATGFEGIYDGQAHTISVTAPENATIKYGTTEGTYDLTAAPSYTDVCENTVYYQVTKANYNDVTGSATVKITEATLTGVSATGFEGTYDGQAHTITVTAPEGAIIKYGTTAGTYDKDASPTYTNVGTYTIYYQVTKANYNAITGSATVKITEATLTGVSATGFEGTYDGQAHTITVTAPEGATIKYGTAAGTYNLTDAPTYTEVGENTVYYQVTKANFTAFTGSASVKITEAIMTGVSATGFEGTYDGQAHTITVTAPEGATIKYGTTEGTYNLTAAPTYTEVGTYTIYYQVTTANYAAATGSASVKITEATLTGVSAAGYVGTYDGQAHTITITVPDGTTIKYGTTAGTYDLTDAPTYTEVGAYTVYYKVTKANYTDVTGSQTVTINKAAGTISFGTGTVNKTYGDEAFTNVLTKTGDGEVTYTSNNPDVATVNATTGEVTIVSYGEAIITATVTDGTRYTYENKTASYNLIVNRPQTQDGYALWIGDIQVTSDNCNDIFGDAEFDDNGDISKSGSYTFIPTTNKLFINDNQRHVDPNDPNAQEELISIESRLPNLIIYLNGEIASKIKSIVFNNQGNNANEGTLTFTTNGQQAGKLDIKNDEGKSAISGFKRINYEWGLAIIDPEGTYLAGNELYKAEENPENPLFIPANIITVGKPMEVMNKIVPLDENSLVQKDENGEPVIGDDGEPVVIEDYTNVIIDNVILITAPQSTDPDSGEGHDDSDGISGIAFESTMTDDEVKEIADAVNNNEYLPGGQTYAENFSGVTIQLPPGEGYILATIMTDPGYSWHLSINGEDAITIKEGVALISNYVDHGDGTADVTIYFNVDEPTYCYLYLVEDISAVRGISRIGKRERVHGKVVSVGVKVVKAKSSNPASEASGGVLPESEDPVLDEGSLTGITTVVANKPLSNNKWYDLQGRQIDQPTKAGLYIKNGKKYIIK